MASGGREMEFLLAFAGKLDPSLSSAIDTITKKVNALGKTGSKSSLARVNSGLDQVQKAVQKVQGKFKDWGASTKALDKVSGGIDKIKQGLDSKGAKVAFGVLDGIGAGAKAAVKGTAKVVKAEAAFTAAAASGIGALAVKSLGYYSDYEQLVGGVDTLFKGSSQTVQDYANNAYKTAGVSANQYMETVTSFSASLINSLGGNTEQAAQMANMAITDMSDNANKMGTDMSEIQRAYQSLARGNYGMLDNLKLGYGGTKSEMERLIKDANELEKAQGRAGDLQIGKFADVVQAIHDVQENMDITGTTAKEAATTIEGSMNSAKAAWANWLTGLGNENADMDGLTDQLMESIGTAASNIIPRLEVILTSIGSFLTSRGPQIVQSLVSGVMSALGTLLPVGASVIMSLAQGIVASAPQILSAGFEIIMFLAQGIASSMPQVISMGAQLLSAFANACSTYLPMLIPLGVQAVINFALGLAQNLPSLAASAGQILVALAQGIAQSIPLLVQQGPQIIASLVQGIIGAVGELLSAGWQIVQILGQAILDGLANIGSMIGDFFVGLFTGQPVEVPAEIGELDTSNATGADIPTIEANAEIDTLDTSVIDAASFPTAEIAVETGPVDTSSIDALKDIGSTTIEAPSVSGMTADYSGIISGAEEAKSQVVSTFSGMGGEISSAVSSGMGSVSYDSLISGATSARDQIVQVFSTVGTSIATAISSGTAGAGNRFTAIVISAQSTATSVAAAFVGVGSEIATAIVGALSGATSGFISFTAAGTSSATQVMSAQTMAAMAIMSVWTMALAAVAARAYATVSSFYAMSAAGVSAAGAISGSMSGVAGNISSITSAAYAAVGALNAMASAARSASSAAASAAAAKAVGFATGGITNGPGVVGEDPRYPHEYVISPNPAYRAQNKGYLAAAARAIGMTVSNLDAIDKDPWTMGGRIVNDGAAVTSNYEMHTTVNVGGVTFAPEITVKGNASRDDIVAALRKVQPEFREFMLDVLAEAEVGDYAVDFN